MDKNFCTRKILRVLPSFLHFLEAKDIKKLFKITPKTISPGEFEKINFKVQRNNANSGKISQKPQNLFRHLVFLEIISFEKIFLAVAQKFEFE